MVDWEKQSRHFFLSFSVFLSLSPRSFCCNALEPEREKRGIVILVACSLFSEIQTQAWNSRTREKRKRERKKEKPPPLPPQKRKEKTNGSLSLFRPRPPCSHLLHHLPSSLLTTNTATTTTKPNSLITAIKTPYLSNGRIDLDSYDALVASQLASGVDGLVIGGTTGEGQLMSWDEHVMLIAHTVNAFGGNAASRSKGEKSLLVVGNTGSNATREALHATEQGFAVGMDCSLQINPYYGKTSSAGLLRHFGAALSEG